MQKCILHNTNVYLWSKSRVRDLRHILTKQYTHLFTFLFSLFIPSTYHFILSFFLPLLSFLSLPLIAPLFLFTFFFLPSLPTLFISCNIFSSTSLAYMLHIRTLLWRIPMNVSELREINTQTRYQKNVLPLYSAPKILPFIVVVLNWSLL